jgi:hypothetical protein
MVDETEMECMGTYEVPLDELEDLPTLHQGQADDCKIETVNADGRPVERVWLSRCGVEDGEPWDNKVTVERLDERFRWVTAELWQAQ